MDAFFTPADVAQSMVEFCMDKPLIVADFTSGDGSLLIAARKKWPSCTVIASDINSSSLQKVEKALDGVVIGKCDFLNSRSRASCKVLRNVKGKVSLVLLNPPFSCRGGTKRTVSIGDSRIQVSVALAFTLTAFGFLRPGGQLIALLPAGCLKSEKDALGWKTLLACNGQMEVMRSHGKNVFDDCSPTICIVRITKRLLPSAIDNSHLSASFTEPLLQNTIELMRGHRPMFSLRVSRSKSKIPFVHTTELSNGSVNLSKRFVQSPKSDISGPAVLIPRVGLPRRDKIALLTYSVDVSLSDCVFALKCPTLDIAGALQMKICVDWDRFRMLYGGTGAPYLTTKRLALWLMENHYQISTEAIKSRQLRKVLQSTVQEFQLSRLIEGARSQFNVTYNRLAQYDKDIENTVIH